MQAAAGDDMKSVPDQDLGVGVLVAGAGVDACIGQLQLLNQQTPLHVEVAAVSLRELGGGGVGVTDTQGSSRPSTESRAAAQTHT